MNAYQYLSPREAYAAYITGSVIVDVSETPEAPKKYVDLKQLIRIPFAELDQRFGELPKNRQVVFVSRIGIKSKEAARFLAAKGYSNVATVDGGLSAWEEEGLPVKN